MNKTRNLLPELINNATIIEDKIQELVLKLTKFNNDLEYFASDIKTIGYNNETNQAIGQIEQMIYDIETYQTWLDEFESKTNDIDSHLDDCVIYVYSV